MIEEMKAKDTNTKTQLSLAAALFFSPLVQNMLNNNTRNITEQDKAFIRGYIKFGYITLLFGCITLGSGAMSYLFDSRVLTIVYTVSIFILLLLLIISVVSILSDIRLLQSKDDTITLSPVEGAKKDILLKYIPLYNIYLWYSTHSFDKPNWRIKESLLWWTLICAVSMLGNIALLTTLLIFLLLRVASLLSDIDIINARIKQWLNVLFLKNPEELRGYVTGIILYSSKKIRKLITSKKEESSLLMEINQEKKIYSQIINATTPTIVWEYILGLFLLGGGLYFSKLNFALRTYSLGLGLFILRYVVMLVHIKYLPHLPIAKELVELLQKIQRNIKK